MAKEGRPGVPGAARRGDGPGGARRVVVRVPAGSAGAPRRRAGADAEPAPGGRFGSPLVRLALLGLGLVAVVALAADLRRMFAARDVRPVRAPADEAAALEMGRDDRTFADAQGRFRLKVPASWQALTGRDAEPYAAGFRGPRGVEFYVRVTPAAHDRFPLLLREIRRIEDDWGLNMNVATNEFRGWPSVERSARLVKQHVWLLDFLVGRAAHHLQFACPRDDVAAYSNLWAGLRAAYEPAEPPQAGGQGP